MATGLAQRESVDPSAMPMFLYKELGFQAFASTDDKRNLCLLLFSRFVRMFAFGSIAPILVLHLRLLGFPDKLVGQFLSLTLLGDVLVSLTVTWTADKLGRRKLLAAGSLLFGMSGVVFALSTDFVPLLIAAVLGVISVSGNEVGPFAALETSILSQILKPGERVYLNTWYQAVGQLATAAGSLTSGFVITRLVDDHHWQLVKAYQAVFAFSAILAVVKIVASLAMSVAAELEDTKASADTLVAPATAPSASDERTPLIAQESARSSVENIASSVEAATIVPARSPLGLIATIGPLFALDSFASSLIPTSFVSYWLRLTFNAPLATISSVISAGFILAFTSSFAAGFISRKIGLVNTMVWTHLPAQFMTICVAFTTQLQLAIVLLLARMTLATMDAAPKLAFLAAAIPKESRTRVMGTVNVMKTLASAIGPSLSGYLASQGRLNHSFVICGSIKIIYDLLLLYWARQLDLQPRAQRRLAPNDESGQHGKVCWYCCSLGLGKNMDSNLAEYDAHLLALAVLAQDGFLDGVEEVYIVTDSSAALHQARQAPHIELPARHQNVRVILRDIPGHFGALGNELADRFAQRGRIGRLIIDELSHLLVTFARTRYLRNLMNAPFDASTGMIST
ncbi:uncharacterized protein L969DRAFT_94407 [Mixia osmundae IAM 14324]|uniref:Major facilitator superfamily (MFS) profile domain-containing protein n=1 Tax=Mixia osmundae (strain CBS 9802 / IAM 14324 / JCM 22182 / KY 12970) TaxID=764103 RepID=G7E3D9_MIXOS|nr:uncharacterized protein L969DRAFT_94407 [Mixia osmundae IAM 14324]KEI39335.1 hypothetical protein L969DRAFT_94407 [Mixia osmundae IAM 14324]GAA97349.1 hypothetical protein E5Q_04027 [Mixia osmundae IAM 14324]